MKDWTGNSRALASLLGVNKDMTTKSREEHDYYATQPIAAELLIEIENLSLNIWECACGEGHLAKVFAEKGFNVLATDLIDRGYGERCDFLDDLETLPYRNYDGDIVTNPPYKYAQEFIEKALDLVGDGHKVCMFLKVQFLEGKGRRKLYETTPLAEYG